MTEFLDGVRDGAKGEVFDLTTVNFDAMELAKLLHDRNGWAARLTKLDQNKTSVNAEIWKKLRNEYDQKLKARENELLTLRDKMRKKLDEMGKLKDSIEREFPGLQKRREELQLRYELGDFNQEFYDYVNRELTFQIEVRQKKVEVLGKNMAFYRDALGSEDGTFGVSERQATAAKESAESEAFGKGGSGPPASMTVPEVTTPLDDTRRGFAARPASAAKAPEAVREASVAVLERPAARASAPAPAPAPPVEEDLQDVDEAVEEPAPAVPPAEEVEEVEEVEEEASVASVSADDDDGLQNLPSEELELGSTPPRGVFAPPEAEDDDDAVAAAEDDDDLAVPSSSMLEETTEEEVVEEISESVEEGDSPDSLLPAEDDDDLSIDPPPAISFANVPAEEATEDEEEDSEVTMARTHDDGGVQELEEDVPEDLTVEEDPGSGRAHGGSGLDTEEQGLLMEEDMSLGDESLSGIDVDDDDDGTEEASGWEGTEEMQPSARAQAGIDAMEDMSDALARGAEADPEREEAKKILEEVNLEELERAVEGIEGDGEDEELRGFVRDVSGRRGESSLPPPAVLEVVEGINLGKVFPVSRTSSVTSIGKAPDNTIAMPEDKALSRYHAKIVYRQSKFVILDLDSTNGTGVNGEAITEADLQDEDEIIMGGSRYIFRITSRG